MLYYIFFIICLFEVINAAIKSENEVINALKGYNSEVTLNFNSQININKNITINNSIRKLSIIGSSLTSSSLYLNYPFNFNSNLEEIEIKNININGDLYFRNNKRIVFNTVNLNGYIHSEFDEYTNEYFTIKKLAYIPAGKFVKNCISLSGNVNIDNSSFQGSSACQDRLLHYNGFSSYTFDLKESSFNGDKKCPFLHIEYASKANIEYTLFEKGYSSGDIDGGAAMKVSNSNLYVKLCTFNNILSVNNGGAFNLINNPKVEGLSLNFDSVTSLGLGSIFHISSSEVHLENIVQKNTGNLKNMKGGGLIMNIEQQSNVDVDTYYGKNLINNYSSGSAFLLSEYSILKARNIYIKDLKGHGEDDGLFYTSQDSTNIQFNFKNVTLNRLYQSSKSQSSIVFIDKNNYGVIEDMKVYNSGGHNTNLIYAFDNSIIEFNGLQVDNFYSEMTKELIYFYSEENYDKDNPSLILNNFNITNIISQGVLLRSRNGSMDIKNGNFKNIHVCNKFNNCTNIRSDDSLVQNTEFLLVKDGGIVNVNVTNVNIDNMNGDVGNSILRTYLDFYWNSVTNSYFKNGFMNMDESRDTSGRFRANYITFTNNTSEYGTFLNVNVFKKGTGSKILIKECEFKNNTASKFGGVVYSTGSDNHMHVEFDSCRFYSNHAKLGKDVYCYTKTSSPSIRYGNFYEKDLVTLPSNFKLDEKTYNGEVSILSGETIPDNITCYLYDDTGKQMYFPKERNSLQLEDFAFFNVEIDDTSNAKILGQTQDYCWDDRCIFPAVKVIGNPGVYTLSLNFITHGEYKTFIQNSVSIKVRILNCNEKTHNYQINSNTNLKSCYIPKCEFGCNDGFCANDDYCDCTNSTLKGKYCNEYEQLQRYPILDFFVIGIAGVIIIGTIVLIGMTLNYKNHPIIKGGGVEFLIIILVGLIVNVFNAALLTFNKTKFLCYLIYLVSNTGFSFVFGSIFVKTYRIYKIFCHRKKLELGIKIEIMYLIIILMTLFHWLMSLVWFIFKKIDTKKSYTADQREFLRCDYPISKNISTLFNLGILMCEFVLSYAIRNVEKKYKEALAIPAYVYIICTLLVNIMNNQSVLNVIIQDYFEIVGTIVNTSVIIYYLFLRKFIEIHRRKSLEASVSCVKIFKEGGGSFNSLNNSLDFIRSNSQKHLNR